MTLLAVLSDIHGNLPALEAVLQDFEQFDVDQVVVAGDVINWGPISAQVTEHVIRAGWPVIRGNNEFYLLDFNTPRAPEEWRDQRQWVMLRWLRQQLAGDLHKSIAGWPDSISLRFADAPPVKVAHGTHQDPWEPLFPSYTDARLAQALQGIEETTMIAGHTFTPEDYRVE